MEATGSCRCQEVLVVELGKSQKAPRQEIRDHGFHAVDGTRAFHARHCYFEPCNRGDWSKSAGRDKVGLPAGSNCGAWL
jgi:hypothetical protein